MYKVAIVDDEVLIRQGLSVLINMNENLVNDISVNNGQELIDCLKTKECDFPDLVLCDLEMPVLDGIETTKILQDLYPKLKIIILSHHYEASLIMKMIEIGASAYMPKNEKPNEFFATIINVIEKGFHYNDFVIKIIREKMLFGPTKSKYLLDVQLTSREEEVLSLLCEQKTTKEIGEELYISARTVEGHRNNLLLKTDSKNTAGLIIYAIEHGFFTVKIKESFWK